MLGIEFVFINMTRLMNEEAAQIYLDKAKKQTRDVVLHSAIQKYRNPTGSAIIQLIISLNDQKRSQDLCCLFFVYSLVGLSEIQVLTTHVLKSRNSYSLLIGRILLFCLEWIIHTLKIDYRNRPNNRIKFNKNSIFLAEREGFEPSIRY